MLQTSKILQSRNDWKCKAVQRAYEIREQRKSLKRHQERITQLKTQIRAMEQAAEVKKNTSSS